MSIFGIDYSEVYGPDDDNCNKCGELKRWTAGRRFICPRCAEVKYEDLVPFDEEEEFLRTPKYQLRD